MCRDTATGEDSLGFKPYVEAIAEFLTAEGTLAPITLSIEGQWGCGKSSFMEQLKKKIEKGNISDIKIEKFFKYLFSKSEDKISDELSPLISFLKDKFSKNGENESFDPCSFKNKLRATLKYIFSKIKRREYFTVWFNCWRYEKEDELWAAFALNFMEQLSEQLSWKWRQWAKIKLVWLRLKFKWKSNSSILFHILLRVIYIVGIALFWGAILYYSPRLMEWLFSYSTDDGVRKITNILLILTASVGLIRHLFSFGKDFFKLLGNPFDFSKFVKNSNYVEHISFIEHFHSDFNKIIESYAGNSRVYVFVDDLDRCETPKAAELMQALNLMISDKSNVYFSIGIDRKVISAGLAARNKSILRYLNVDGLKYGYDFIEKFIQLPFKVPSPTDGDFKKFMNPENKPGSPSKVSRLLHVLGGLLSHLKTSSSNSQSDKESVQPESADSVEPGDEIPEDVTKEKSEKVEKITNDQDCDKKSGEWDHILEMIAPVLDRNPRRMKQFFNLFRFQRKIGDRTGLFSYDRDTKLENMWNCRKLAKFVAISMKWPSLVSALGSNRMLLNQLQTYALMPENEDKKLEEWIKDERLVELLRYGCVERGNLSQNATEYSLYGLDFSKLLQISPVVAYPDDNLSSSRIEMEFVRIPSGDFMMGSPDGEDGRLDNESPVHKVTIKNSFYLGKYPVTQKQWEKVMGSNSSSFKGDDLPVESVSWMDVQEFIKKLNEMEGTDEYRLPSEAEWEYACRAGTTTRYSFGVDESKLGDYAWYDKNSDSKTHPVGQKKPNSWDLYDMHGNVWEWVQDSYHSNYNGAWEDGDSPYRVIRGGCWGDDAGNCRSANLNGDDSGSRSSSVGFRLLRKL